MPQQRCLGSISNQIISNDCQCRGSNPSILTRPSVQEGVRRFGEVHSPEALERMRAMSPIAHVQAVTAPVMLLLGAKDRRVPHDDGLRYGAALKASGSRCKALHGISFRQNHSFLLAAYYSVSIHPC